MWIVLIIKPSGLFRAVWLFLLSVAVWISCVLGFFLFCLCGAINSIPPLIFQSLIKRVAVVRFTTYQNIRSFIQKSVIDSFVRQFYFVGKALSIWAATGKPEASEITMILVPFPRFVLPTTRPFFLPDWSLRQWTFCECLFHYCITYSKPYV